MPQRINWIDSAKGMGILAVVLGHSVMSISPFLYWFHMPLFFFLSGFLYKPKEQFVIKKFSALLVPYFTFFMLITIVRYADEGIPTIEGFLKDTFSLFYGGELLAGYYGVFWFVTCLFVLTVVYHFIFKKIQDWKTWIGIVITCYILSYVYSITLKELTLAWNIDVVLYSIVFYALGHLYKRFKQTFDQYKVILNLTSIAVVYLMLIAQISGKIEYRLDLKSQLYNHLGLDLILPLSCIVLLISISKLLAKNKVLLFTFNTLGSSSLTIMYLHLVFLILLPKYSSLPYWGVILLSITLPVMFHMISKNFVILRMFCLGHLYQYLPKRLTTK